MARFNIALLLIDAAVRRAFVDLARSDFAAVADGYLLGAGALPHITLCQFHAPSEQAAIDVFHSWEGKKDLDLQIENFRLRKGSPPHSGKLWAEYLVEQHPALLEQQKNCVQHVKQAGLEILTNVTPYSPHLTLARIADTVADVPSPDPPYRHRLAFRPAIGAASENGVFVKELS
jgi:hypothetical protein